MRHFEIRIRTACAGSAAIALTASGRLSQGLLVLAVGLLSEVAAALATAVHAVGEGVGDGLRQRLRRRVSTDESRERRRRP